MAFVRRSAVLLAMARAASTRVAAPGLARCLRTIFTDALGAQPGLEVRRVTPRRSLGRAFPAASLAAPAPTVASRMATA